MAATKYNLTIEQGATFVFQITITDKSTGLARDLSNYTARGMIRDYIEAPDPLAVFTFAPLTNDGVIRMSLPSTITSALAFSNTSGVYDVELVENGSNPENVERLLQGSTFLSKEVTRNV